MALALLLNRVTLTSLGITDVPLSASTANGALKHLSNIMTHCVGGKRTDSVPVPKESRQIGRIGRKGDVSGQ